MKRNLILAAVTLVGMAGAYVLAQTPAPGGPMGGDMKGMKDMQEKMSPEMKAMMEKMSPEMKMRCQMVMSTAVSPSDPAAMLALKGQLKLTEVQTAQLKAINMEARDKAMMVLTADQKTTLDALPKTSQTKTSQTMMDMHEQMMGQMQKKMGGKMDDQQMSCPMMQMMKTEQGPTSAPEAIAPTEVDHSAHH